MSRPILLKTILLLAVSVGLCAMPEGAFAQRGGRGGFGGFHGGGVGGFRGGSFGGFRGGSFGGFRAGFGRFHGPGFGGFRGPGFGGFRGGFGWRNGFWGFPRFGSGWGWGVNVGFGFGPYWAWGYPYGYWPWWGPYAYSPDPDPYSYDDPSSADDPSYRHSGCDYRYSDCSGDGRAPEHNSKPSDHTSPAKPSNSAVLQSVPDRDYRASNSNDYRVTTHAQPAPANHDTVGYMFADLKTLQPSSQMRPAVRNVVQALRAMPPAARERQLSSGRYAGFSPEEKELLQELVQAQRAQ
jgi:hypothetical protein